MTTRIVKIIISDDDLDGFEIYVNVNETTTEEYLLNHIMNKIADFLEKYNLINIQERIFSRTLHIHGWVASEIYLESFLVYHVCTRCEEIITIQ